MKEAPAAPVEYGEIFPRGALTTTTAEGENAHGTDFLTSATALGVSAFNF